MTQPDLTDETLMAYADGALNESDAAAVAAALESDPQAAAKVAAFRQTGARLAGAARGLDEVPPALRARIEETLAASRPAAGGGDAAEPAPAGTVTPFRARPAAQARARLAGGGWPMALAASLALAIGLGAGLGLRDSGAPSDGGQLALLPSDGLAPLLDTLPSGETAPLADGALSVVSSFRAGDGRLCREVEFAGADAAAALAVLCRNAGDWQPQLAMRLGQSDGFAPASGLETVETFLGTLDAGPPLTPEEEAAALAR